ncbi:hypothetical protein EVAR_94075_1 [Eumeta japonica]|uniref:Uncharacterized protein n=1 Tax=Eumeta variegata TaxID=151549 RepID=A0A4C1V6Y1_EUMVA|nr:hypothetical protein EVAR_94075_1 [Eumeta japonica]
MVPVRGSSADCTPRGTGVPFEGQRSASRGSTTNTTTQVVRTPTSAPGPSQWSAMRQTIGSFFRKRREKVNGEITEVPLKVRARCAHAAAAPRTGSHLMYFQFNFTPHRLCGILKSGTYGTRAIKAISSRRFLCKLLSLFSYNGLNFAPGAPFAGAPERCRLQASPLAESADLCTSSYVRGAPNRTGPAGGAF